MPALSGIFQPDPVSYTARLGAEDVTIVFDAAKMTGVWERNIRQALATEDVDTVTQNLFSVFISWDVVDDQGVPVPISNEILLQLPGKALINLFRGMQEAAEPSSEEGNVSSATSSSAVPSSTPTQASPQNGPTPSSSPVPSASQSQT